MKISAQMLSLNITSRDIEIILSVFDYDGMFSYQIKNRFWGQNGHPGTYYARLARLIDADYLRARPMNSLTGRGSGTRLVTIGRTSHRLLRERRGLDDRGIKQLRHSLPLADWPHDAAVRDVRLALEAAATAHPAVVGVEWTNEAVFKRAPITVVVPGAQASVDLVPDGGFVLELRSGQRKQHFLELDRDTEHRNRIVGRLRAYLVHVGARSIPVLWVVPSVARAEQLQRWMKQEADALQLRPAIFAVTLAELADQRRVLTHPIWQVVGGDRKSLLPSTSSAERGRAA